MSRSHPANYFTSPKSRMRFLPKFKYLRLVKSVKAASPDQILLPIKSMLTKFWILGRLSMTLSRQSCALNLWHALNPSRKPLSESEMPSSRSTLVMFKFRVLLLSSNISALNLLTNIFSIDWGFGVLGLGLGWGSGSGLGLETGTWSYRPTCRRCWRSLCGRCGGPGWG